VDADQKQIVKPDAADSDVQSTFFDTWLTEQVQAKTLDPLKDFVQVPADMVTTSGSGLDPDISLANAVYQKDNVVPAYAGKLAADYVGQDADKGLTDEAKKKLQDELTEKLTPKIGAIVDKLLGDLAYRPMFGLTGDKPLVNVLQLNLRLQSEAAKIKVP
jgi:K+-transporting ATPase ATPase C chain